uniref:SJCHGC02902 protein n=1 Tax=Schistosoma japonicum TaxID=6182 RepID=Q5DGM9_SCHJA|nr:SJCHGC02902 protein [Schistosoma japonicum]
MLLVRKRVLGKDGKSIDEVLKLHQLRWLGHVLRMSNYRLPRRAMFCGVGIGWKKARGGQTKTWQKSMKSLTSGLSHVGRCRLRSCDLLHESHQWLETLNDMAQNRLRWRRCIHSLCSLKI